MNLDYPGDRTDKIVLWVGTVLAALCLLAFIFAIVKGQWKWSLAPLLAAVLIYGAAYGYDVWHCTKFGKSWSDCAKQIPSYYKF